jgi:hypothetical protein
MFNFIFKFQVTHISHWQGAAALRCADLKKFKFKFTEFHFVINLLCTVAPRPGPNSYPPLGRQPFNLLFKSPARSPGSGQ